MLRKIKRHTGMEDKLYKDMYPTGCTPQSSMVCPKSTKQAPPQAYCIKQGSVTYGVAKVPAKILQSQVGKSPHHKQSTKNFINTVSKVTLLLGECLCSYDVSALFTSVPIDPALNIIKEL